MLLDKGIAGQVRRKIVHRSEESEFGEELWPKSGQHCASFWKGAARDFSEGNQISAALHAFVANI